MSNHTKPNDVTTPLTVAPGDPHWSEPEHDQRSMEQLYDYHDPVSLQQGGYTTGGALTMFGKVGFEPGQAVMNVDHGTIYDMILTRRYGTQGTFDFVVSQDMKNSNGVLGDFRTDVEHGFDICKVDMDMTTLNDEVTAMSNNRFRVRMKDGEARKVLRVIVPYRTAVRTFDAVELEKEFTYWVKEKSYSFAGYNEWEHYKRIMPLHHEIMTDYPAAVNRFTSKDSGIEYFLRDSNNTTFTDVHGLGGWNGRSRGSVNLPLRLDYTDEMIYNSNENKDRAMPGLGYPYTSMMQHALGDLNISRGITDTKTMAPDPLYQTDSANNGPQSIGEDGEKSLVREIKKYTQSHLQKAHELLTTSGAFQSTVSQHRTKYRVKTLPTPTSFVEPVVGLPGSDEWIDQFPVYDHDTLLYTVGNSYDTVFFSRVYADVNPMFIHDEVDAGPGSSTVRSWRPSMNTSKVDWSSKYYLTWFNTTVGIGYLGSDHHYGYPNGVGGGKGGNRPDLDFQTKIANESTSERDRIEAELMSLVNEVSGYDGGGDAMKPHHEANFYIAGSTPASTLYDYIIGNTDSTSFRSKKLDLHTATDTQIWDSEYTSYDQPTQGEVIFTAGRPEHVVLNDDSRSAIFNWKGVVNDVSIQDGILTRYTLPPANPQYMHSALEPSASVELKTVALADPSLGQLNALKAHVEHVLDKGSSPAGDTGSYLGPRPPHFPAPPGNINYQARGPAIVPAIRPDGKTPHLFQGTTYLLQNLTNIYSPHGTSAQSAISWLDTWYTKLLQAEPAVGTWTQNDISLSGVQGPGEDNTSHVLYDLSNLTHEQDTYKQNANLKGYYKSCVNHNNRELRLEISKYNESDPVDLDLTTRSEVFINKAPIYEVLAHAQYDDTVREEYRMSPAPTMRNLATWHDTPTEPSVVDQIFVPDGASNASDVLFLSLEAGSLSGGSIPTSKQVIAAPVKAGTLQIVSTSNPSNAQISEFTTPIIKVARGSTYTLDTYIFKNTGGKPITIHLPLNPSDPLVVGQTSYVETMDAATGAVTTATGDKTDDWSVTINNTGNLSQAQVNGMPMNNTYIMQPDDTLQLLVELNVTSHASTYDISIPVKIDNDGLLTSGGISFPTISIT